MSQKTIRMLVTCMVEVETILPVEEAVEEFQTDCAYEFPDTDNVKVVKTEWRETNKISYTEVNKVGTQILLKPLKNELKQNRGTINS